MDILTKYKLIEKIVAIEDEGLLDKINDLLSEKENVFFKVESGTVAAKNSDDSHPYEDVIIALRKKYIS